MQVEAEARPDGSSEAHPASREGIERVGVIVGPVEAWIADVTIRGEGVADRTFEHRPTLQLLCADGLQVSVECAGAVLEGGEEHRARGRWSEVRRSPPGSLVDRYDAGPRFPVEVVARAFTPGDRVRVRGVVVGRAAVAAPSYRHGARGDVTAIRAERIGPPVTPEKRPRSPLKNRIRRISERDGFESSSGPTTRCHSIVEEGRAARRAHPARKTRTEILQRAPSSLGATLFGLLLLGGALLSSLAVALDTEGAVGPAWLRGGLITGALTVTWHLASRLAGQMHVHSCIPHRSFLPQFASVQATESRAHHTGFPVTSMLILAMVTCGSLYALPFMLGAPPPSDDHPLVGLMTVVTWSLSLVLVVQLVGRDRASARSASTLLTARTKLPPGWHVASGRISDSTTRTVCYAIGTEGPRTFARSSERYDTPATLELVTSDGPFVVQLEGCSLAMSRWHRADPAGTCTDDGRTWDDSLIYAARPDMNALVAGHLDEATGTFRARGPESLLVFISERGEARRVLARQLALHHACWIAPSLGIIYTMLTLGAR